MVAPKRPIYVCFGPRDPGVFEAFRLTQWRNAAGFLFFGRLDTTYGRHTIAPMTLTLSSEPPQVPARRPCSQ